ncbi:hypothetical protein K8I61_17295 [bacterium]|nr:hypothetical protein [bacterium]
MELTSLIDKLRADLGETADSLPRATAKRMIEKALVRLAADGKGAFTMTGDEESETVSPDPNATQEELILLLAAYFWASVQRKASIGRAFSYKSGDKAVNRISTATNWKEFAAELLAMYREAAGLDKIPPVEGRIGEMGAAYTEATA